MHRALVLKPTAFPVGLARKSAICETGRNLRAYFSIEPRQKEKPMIKASLLALTLLCSFTLLQAQNQPAQTPPQSPTPHQSQSPNLPAQSPEQSQTPSQPATAATSPNTVKGCVRIAADHFTLTDESGTTYQLQGDTSNVSAHVGHEVQITGSSSNANSDNTTANTPPEASQAPQSQPPTLAVEKIQHIADSCPTTGK